MPRKELSLGAKSHTPPVFINKVVLECSPANHLHIASGCILTKTVGSVVVIVSKWPTKPETFTTWPFTEKIC